MSTAGMPSASAPDPTVGSVPRKRPRQDSQSEDEGEISEGAPCEITDAAALDDLDKLRSHGSRFNIQHRLIHVVEFLQWHQNDLTRNTKLVVPQNYYQRDSTQGWDKDKESKYLRAVMAGQAFTPFVVNAKRKDARLMDGGHRLNTIKRFYENKVGMQIGDSAYMYKQLPEDDREHFDQQYLHVLEFKDLPLKDEVDNYIKLNSGLAFSHGEKLYATQSFNPITQLAIKITKSSCNWDPPKDEIDQICKIVGAGRSSGLKSDILVTAYLTYNLKFRKLGDPIATTMAENFVQTVCAFNKDAEYKDTASPEIGEQSRDTVVELIRRTLNLYTTMSTIVSDPSRLDVFISRDVKSVTGQTDFRRFVMCCLAVAEIPNDKLDAEVFTRFVSDVHHSTATFKNGTSLHRILTGDIHLKRAQIKKVVDGYCAFWQSMRK